MLCDHTQPKRAARHQHTRRTVHGDARTGPACPLSRTNHLRAPDPTSWPGRRPIVITPPGNYYDFALPVLFGASAYHSGTSFAFGTARLRSSLISFSSSISLSRRRSSICTSISRSRARRASSNRSRSFARTSVGNPTSCGTTGTMCSRRAACAASCAACIALKSGMGSCACDRDLLWPMLPVPPPADFSKSALRASIRASEWKWNSIGFVGFAGGSADA
ncbi:uncharacterized protein B0H18DRAFT_456632 [Fomitopsis serialis]|uniref:uncharacterized protein n=1 Tax=Fomitopsis serialis TaxID=139415 RepID=UPI002008796C|nr:uncharacterized protein B0H18DRAFT_456632 [Neoantrodia serialis]KAH9923612.1 hypothetical protein B0H18DRAFT_456632 [Neoantrodia serialis]